MSVQNLTPAKVYMHKCEALHGHGWYFHMISYKLWLLFPNLVLWCIIMQGLIWSKYDNVDYIFWTSDPFATKLGLIEHCHKPECFMERLDCCVHGQGHIIIRWTVLWKEWIAVLWSRSRSQKRFRIPVNVHLDDIILVALRLRLIQWNTSILSAYKPSRWKSRTLWKLVSRRVHTGLNCSILLLLCTNYSPFPPLFPSSISLYKGAS